MKFFKKNKKAIIRSLFVAAGFVLAWLTTRNM